MWESSSYARLSYTWPIYWFKEASDFDFEYSSNIQSRFSFFRFFLSHSLSLYICVWSKGYVVDVL